MTNRLTLARDFQRRTTRLEKGYTKEVLRLLREHRKTLVDVVLSLGINSPQLIPQLSREVETLGRVVASEGKKIKGLALENAQESATRQLNYYVAAVEGAPQVNILANQRGAGAAVNVLGEPPGWVAGYYAGLISEVNRLRTAQVGSDEAIAALFAERISDRASVYRKNKNFAAVESDRLVWAVMAGAVGALLFNDVGIKQKQVVAAIDERTTDCCLQAHGQIVDEDQKFTLTGTPRFARYMSWTPFHWNCRSAVVLYNPIYDEIEGVTTKDMRGAARAEINARAQTGKRQEIHPAHATSRRD